MVVVEKDKKTEIPNKTTIILKSFSKDLPKEQEEFLNKVVDLNAKENEPKLKKLKQAIIQNCLLKLLNVKDLNITLYYNDIEDVKITNEDLAKYNNNKQEETIEVKYKIYKTTKDHNNKDISEFVDYYEEIDGQKNYKTEKFKMDIYKLPDDFENHIYLCTNDVAVKDILVKKHILPKNITINGENNEKYKLLILINDAEGYSFLNNHSNSERDDFLESLDFSLKTEKELVKIKQWQLPYKEEPVLFFEDLVDNIQTILYKKFPEIEKNDNEMKEKFKIAEDYIKNHNLSKEQANKILDRRTLRCLNKENAIEAFNEKIGSEKGKKVEENQENIVKLQNEIIKIINNDNFDEEKLKEKVEKQTQFIKEANKNELTNYVLRRKYIIERLKKVFNTTNDKLKEKELHNLFATKRNDFDVNQYDKTNLWLLDDKFMFFDRLFSEQELDKITEELLKNDTTFSKNLNTDKPEENTEEKEFERAKIRRPDIVLFKDKNNNLRKIVLIEFKRPDADDYDYNKGLYQLKCYTREIARQQKIKATYFGFLLVNNLQNQQTFIDIALANYNVVYSNDVENTYENVEKINFNGEELCKLNLQVISSNAIINDAEARNFVFDKIINKEQD